MLMEGVLIMIQYHHLLPPPNWKRLILYLKYDLLGQLLAYLKFQIGNIGIPLI